MTLGTLNIAFAITHIYSQNQTVTNVPEPMTFFGNTFQIGQTSITYGTVLMFILYLITWYVLRQTAVGRHVYAAGNNPEAARLSGINTSTLLLGVYTVAGLFYGIAALLLVGRTHVGDPNAGQTENLASITAVVLGGTSLFGGAAGSWARWSACSSLASSAMVLQLDRRRFRLSDSRHRHPGDSRRDRRPVRTTKAAMSDTSFANGTTPVLEARGLVKRYGHVTALDGADFELYPGEILAVIGDNGAGKSTLIKALSGALIPDEGEILVDGTPVHFRGPLDARRHGIETVYQDLALATALDISENIFLGREIRRQGLTGSLLRMLDKRRMRREANAHMQDLKIGINSMGQAVETLSGGQRQGVAVARSAAFARHVVIMDEPTAALGVKESHMVLDLIRQVRDAASRSSSSVTTCPRSSRSRIASISNAWGNGWLSSSRETSRCRTPLRS